MDSLLDALQEGRLIELPDNDKADSLQFLTHVLEAIPTLPANTDLVAAVMARENSSNTAIGNGWACPHARVPFDDDLICVVGWSPQGIAYGAPDGKLVHLISMYLVAENQRNHFLREISVLAKALSSYADTERLLGATELNTVRACLLDMIASTRETAGPDTRARMIQLQSRPIAARDQVLQLANLVIESVTIISLMDSRVIVLAQDKSLVQVLEATPGLLDGISKHGMCQNGEWRVVRRNSINYQENRTLYECIAIRPLSVNTQPSSVLGTKG
jgi:PTS system nitrogen regulatory IIA component